MNSPPKNHDFRQKKYYNRVSKPIMASIDAVLAMPPPYNSAESLPNGPVSHPRAPTALKIPGAHAPGPAHRPPLQKHNKAKVKLIIKKINKGCLEGPAQLPRTKTTTDNKHTLARDTGRARASLPRRQPGGQDASQAVR